MSEFCFDIPSIQRIQVGACFYMINVFRVCPTWLTLSSGIVEALYEKYERVVGGGSLG